MFYDTLQQRAFEWPHHIVEVLPFHKGYITVSDVLSWVHVDMLSRWARASGLSSAKTLWIEPPPQETSHDTIYLKMIHHLRRDFHILKADEEQYALMYDPTDKALSGVVLYACARSTDVHCCPLPAYGWTIGVVEYGDLNVEGLYHRYGIAPLRYYCSRQHHQDTWKFSHDNLVQAEQEWRALALQLEGVLDFNRWDADHHRKIFSSHMNDDLNMPKVWELLHQLLAAHFYQSCVSILKILGLWDLFVAGDKACIPTSQRNLEVGMTSPSYTSTRERDDGVYRIELQHDNIKKSC